MKKYKFITIKQYAKGLPSKPAFRIYNNKGGDVLGEIGYYKPWKQYVVNFEVLAVFNNSCLKDILDFMEHEIGK